MTRNKIFLVVTSLTFAIVIFILNITVLSKPFFTNSLRQQKEEERDRKWRQDQKSFPIPEDAIKLQFEFSFPKKELEKEDIFLYQPFFLCSDKKGNIYVSDSRNHSILKFDSLGKFLKKIGRKGQGPGELSNPRYICCDDRNNLIVYDSNNRRIQIFSPEGEYLKNFKIFKRFCSMASDDQGLIYASTNSMEGPLIEVLDRGGKLVNSFGERIEFRHNTRSHNDVHISINTKGELFIAWQYFPIVRRYSKEGNLLSEYKVEYKLMRERAKPNYDVRMTGMGIKFFNIISGIRAKEDGFYLFSYYPRIEVLEINLNGEVSNIYWTDSPSFDYMGWDFVVKESAREKMFYILQVFPEPKVEVFSSKTDS